MKLAVFATHPVPYHVPLWRKLARNHGLELKVHYFSDHSIRGGVDPGFGVPVTWDIPMLEGYESEFLTRTADLHAPWRVRINDATGLLKRGGFGAVLLQGYTYAFERQILQAGRSLGLRIVMRGEFTDRGRGPLWKSIARWAYLNRFYSKVDAFAVIGTMAGRHLTGMGIPSKKLFSSPYAVDGERLAAQRAAFDKAACRREMGFEEDAFVFLFSGKLIARKDPLGLVRAIARLGTGDRAALIVIGDGILHDQVRDEGSRLLGSRFHMAGFVNQSQLAKHFIAADCLILPSQFETWGLVVNEAMHFGLPVVVSDQVGCHPDLVIPGITGFTYPAGAEGALVDTLRRVSSNPQTSQEMGKKAADHIRQYSIERATAGILKALGLAHAS